jgi:hypothetical protein
MASSIGRGENGQDDQQLHRRRAGRWRLAGPRRNVDVLEERRVTLLAMAAWMADFEASGFTVRK